MNHSLYKSIIEYDYENLKYNFNYKIYEGDL